MRTGNSGINTLIEITKAPAFISSSRALNQTVVSNLVATLVPVQGRFSFRRGKINSLKYGEEKKDIATN